MSTPEIWQLRNRARQFIDVLINDIDHMSSPWHYIWGDSQIKKTERYQELLIRCLEIAEDYKKNASSEDIINMSEYLHYKSHDIYRHISQNIPYEHDEYNKNIFNKYTKNRWKELINTCDFRFNDPLQKESIKNMDMEILTWIIILIILAGVVIKVVQVTLKTAHQERQAEKPVAELKQESTYRSSDDSPKIVARAVCLIVEERELAQLGIRRVRDEVGSRQRVPVTIKGDQAKHLVRAARYFSLLSPEDAEREEKEKGAFKDETDADWAEASTEDVYVRLTISWRDRPFDKLDKFPILNSIADDADIPLERTRRMPDSSSGRDWMSRV